MQYRTLGNDGPQVSVIGFGAWPIAGGMGHVDESVALSTLHAAFDSGVMLIDTAQGYRGSERIVGKALKNGNRDRCFLATKVSVDYTPQGIRSAIENSLRALDVDYVDLYQLHNYDARFPIAAMMESMARIQQEGKTRYIGVSNFGAREMARALAAVRFQTSQPPYSLFNRQIEAEDIAFCEREGIGILAHSPLAKGLLAGKYTYETTFGDDDERSWFPQFQGALFRSFVDAANRLKSIAQDKGISLAQLAVAWCLRQPAVTCVLVGAKTPEQIRELAAAADVQFTADELARIDAVLTESPSLA